MGPEGGVDCACRAICARARRCGLARTDTFRPDLAPRQSNACVDVEPRQAPPPNPPLFLAVEERLRALCTAVLARSLARGGSLSFHQVGRGTYRGSPRDRARPGRRIRGLAFSRHRLRVWFRRTRAPDLPAAFFQKRESVDQGLRRWRSGHLLGREHGEGKVFLCPASSCATPI